MWYSFIAQDNTPRDKPTIEWLQEAIKLADEIMARIIQENDEHTIHENRLDVGSILRRSTTT